MSVVLRKREQWALLNLLARESLYLHHRPAASMLVRVGGAVGDLGVVERDGLVQGRWSRTGEQVALLGDLDDADLDRVDLSVTPAGWQWLITDPGNRVLDALDNRHRDEIRLRVAITRADLDLDAVAACADAGLVVLTDAGSGAPRLGLRPAAIRDLVDGLLIGLTQAGARVLDPTTH